LVALVSCMNFVSQKLSWQGVTTTTGHTDKSSLDKETNWSEWVPYLQGKNIKHKKNNPAENQCTQNRKRIKKICHHPHSSSSRQFRDFLSPAFLLCWYGRRTRRMCPSVSVVLLRILSNFRVAVLSRGIVFKLTKFCPQVCVWRNFDPLWIRWMKCIHSFPTHRRWCKLCGYFVSKIIMLCSAACCPPSPVWINGHIDSAYPK
jgi:hypothetical protein